MKVFNKIVIANRGEIAVRIIKTLRKLGISSVAVCSSKDRDSLHCLLADEVFVLQGDTLSETYLNADKIVEIAVESGADAIHPGYGFLSENPGFSAKAAVAGVNFIGPPAETIRKMGNKLEARAVARKAGISLIEGFEGKAEDLLHNSADLSYPVIVKAAAGGGGKAMRIVYSPAELEEGLEVTAREAMNYFSDDSLYVEKYFENGRHIEIQVLADHYGNAVIAGERECSMQRRYQKVIEETPAISLRPETRQKMNETALKLVKEISYVNAGTIEFLLDQDQNFYFLEMNTRIQVEHPVTEETSGIDLVEQQIYIAAGNKLGIVQEKIITSGHSIQARLYAEDPEQNYLPSPGFIRYYFEPGLPGLRIDSGLKGPAYIYPDYDPMLAKIVATTPSREESILLLSKALSRFRAAGIKTNREFLKSILAQQDFIQNEISTTWLEKNTEKILSDLSWEKEKPAKEVIFAAWIIKLLDTTGQEGSTIWNSIGYWRNSIRKSLIFKEKQYDLWVREIDADRIVFEIDDQVFTILLHSLNEDRFIFEMDDSWYCSVVVEGDASGDIVYINGWEYTVKAMDYLGELPYLAEDESGNASGPHTVKSPLFGKLMKIYAQEEQMVKKGDLLFTLDAMKIENRITAPFDGCVKEIKARAGDQVKIGQEIVILKNCTQ